MPRKGPAHKKLQPVRTGFSRRNPTHSMKKNQKYVKAATKKGRSKW